MLAGAMASRTDAFSEPIFDLLRQQEVRECDLKVVSDRSNFFPGVTLQALDRFIN